MKRILTAAQMKQADRNTIETMGVPSLVLMERAALSCVEELQNGTWDTGKVLAVCGPGNNGGDGAAIARILKTKGVDAELFCLGNPEKYSEGMRAQKKIADWRIPFAGRGVPEGSGSNLRKRCSCSCRGHPFGDPHGYRRGP